MLEVALTFGSLFLCGMWCYAIYIALYLAHKRGELTKTWIVLGAAPGIVGYAIDVVLFNWIIATLVYWEWPNERTFSARLNRWHRWYTVKGEQGARASRKTDIARYKFTRWWARQLNALTPAALEHIHNHDR